MRIAIAGWMLIVMTVTDAFSSDGSNGPAADEFAAARAVLVREIEAEVRITKSYLGRDELDPRVIAALGTVPRHEFVPRHQQLSAYNNHPLSIGYGQTISQPYIVAVMTDLLQVFAGGRVLEIGTGSGYQAAVLGELCATVYSIEIVEPLGVQAARVLQQLGYTNVHVKTGDGYVGWPEHAPFDGIIVTAAAPYIPEPLIEQLKPGGRMIIPVGRQYSVQRLMLLEKNLAGEVTQKNILPVRFVPLTRD